MSAPVRGRTFRYDGVEVDAGAGTVTCRYADDESAFTEVARFDDSVDLAAPGVDQMVVLYFLLAGLSYFKARASTTVDLASTPVGPATRALLVGSLAGGLGEFALHNGLFPLDVDVVGGTTPRATAVPAPARGLLVPFGGGIDSIVTTSLVVDQDDDASLFIVGPRGERYAAIDAPAAVTGLPVTRCGRYLDAAILHSRDRGWLDGHVPVTAMISALALIAATGSQRRGVAMSNERSASSPTVVVDGHGVNHQWSKSMEFEDLLRAAVAERLDGGPTYASWLRDRSELWVARELARHPEYLGSFMSCNRAFRQDAATRATTWCGECDKCLFIDIVLAPFVERRVLEGIFSGNEPIANTSRIGDLEVFVGVVDNPRPFECVGDADECATALVAASHRADRADQRHLAELAARCAAAPSLESMLIESGPTNAATPRATRDLV